jgi:hypothetical protein
MDSTVQLHSKRLWQQTIRIILNTIKYQNWRATACFTGVIYKCTPKGYLNCFIFYVKNNIQLVEALPGFTSYPAPIAVTSNQYLWGPLLVATYTTTSYVKQSTATEMWTGFIGRPDSIVAPFMPTTNSVTHVIVGSERDDRQVWRLHDENPLWSHMLYCLMPPSYSHIM